VSAKGRRINTVPQPEPAAPAVHTLTMVLSLDVASGRMVIQPVGINLPVETALALLDRARTEIMRAQLAAEQQQQAAAGTPAAKEG
jgi:hypothetical protein